MDMYTSSRRLNRVLKYLEKVDGYKIVLRTVTRPNNYLDVGGDQGGHEGGEHPGFVHGCYHFGPEVDIWAGLQILRKPWLQRDYRLGPYFDVPRADTCWPVIVEFQCPRRGKDFHWSPKICGQIHRMGVQFFPSTPSYI